MPFKSEAQRKYLFANKPDVAEKFAAHTPEDAKLPEHVSKPPKPKAMRVRVISPRNPTGPSSRRR